MGYKALYRKYRPKNFDEVKGQEHIVQTLKNIINTRKISHAYLFSGPRGVGKTSVAKIFASLVNCYHNNDDFCKLCKMCEEEINQNLDIIEMDAASNNGVDSIRELKEKIEHLPVNGKYKVYIIDEVHMLSKGAFNALLKTLEEPPSHAIFILATTDPQKIPVTILSRVQRFNFRRIANSVLSEQIQSVLHQENIKYDPKVLTYISRLAIGGMRDALSMIDQANAYGNGEIKLEDVIYAFGITSIESLIKLANYLYEGQIDEALKLFNDLKNGGIDYKEFLNSFIDLFKDYLIYQKTMNIKLFELINMADFETIKFDEKFALDSFDLLYKLEKDLYYSDEPFQLIEVYLIKMSKQKPQVKKDIAQTQNELRGEEMKNNTDKKKDLQSDTLTSVLSQTQELVIESNIDATSNDIIENDILTGVYDNPFDDEQGIIDTREIDLLSDPTSIIDKDNLQGIKKFDSSYPENMTYKCKYTIEDLIQILLRANVEKLNSAKSVLKTVDLFSKECEDLVKALKEVSVKAANDEYLLLTSNHFGALKYLSEVENTQVVQDFLKSKFHSNLNISLILISKSLFNQIKDEYIKRNETGTLILDEKFALPTIEIEKSDSATKRLFKLLSED